MPDDKALWLGYTTIRRKIIEEIKVFSEKIGKTISIATELSEDEAKVIMEDCDSSLVGWTHGGWNNDNGGGSSW